MNPPITTTTTTNACGNCASRTRWPLHNVRLRGIHRRLCTSCVLRLHPLSFCPSCFQLHDPQPPHPLKRLTCSSCNSYTHSHCVANPPTPYLCPPCANPNFTFFDLDGSGSNPRAVDKKLAMVLLCAARIAAVSMGKAVVVARVEAERKVREAAVARKRAKEALEHVAALVAARERKEEEEEESGGVVSGVKKVEVNCDGVKEEGGGGLDWRNVGVGVGVGLGNGNRVVVKVENVENGNGNGKVGCLPGAK